MQKRLLVTSLAAAAGIAVFAATAVSGDGFLKRYRLRRLSSATSMASPPDVLLNSTEDCPGFPGVPEAIPTDFDPGRYDEISLGGNGKMVAYATATAQLPAPGPKVIVVLREGNPTVTVSAGTGGSDQPSIDIDRLGWRLAFRGPGGDRQGSSESDIYLYTHTSRGDGLPRSSVETPEYPVTETVALTDFANNTGTFARDPALVARSPVVEFEDTEIMYRERSALVAFISDGDFDKGARGPNHAEPGKNDANNEQLFLWREKGNEYTQITRNDDDTATLARPSMSGDGRFIAFESTADLVPGAVNPRDPNEIGNPNGVRQIYLYRDSARGGGLRQLTFGDSGSFAPRMSPNGRSVLFCSTADLLPGGNPEGNFEIFRWRRGASAARRLQQLTQVVQGDNVLPRPMRGANRFVFFSTAAPPTGGAEFGLGIRQCGPTALLATRNRIRLVGGLVDLEQDPESVIVVGPPAAVFASKIHFITNDPLLDPPPIVADDKTETPSPGTANPLQFHMGRATRFPRR